MKKNGNNFRPKFRPKNLDPEAYFAYITSDEFKLKKPTYEDSFKLRMEKWVVEAKSLSAKRLAMISANKELKKHFQKSKKTRKVLRGTNKVIHSRRTNYQ